MQLEEIIQLEQIDCDCSASSKKRSIEELSSLISKGDPNLSGPEVFEKLFSREKLGSTGFGHGVALPHGRSGNISRAKGAFVHLKDSIDFDSVDKEPVDLLFALLVPEHCGDEHLQILSKLAAIFRDEDVRRQLREEDDAQKTFDILKRAWYKS